MHEHCPQHRKMGTAKTKLDKETEEEGEPKIRKNERRVGTK